MPPGEENQQWRKTYEVFELLLSITPQKPDLRRRGAVVDWTVLLDAHHARPLVPFTKRLKKRTFSPRTKYPCFTRRFF